jgi:hypothetical protein
MGKSGATFKIIVTGRSMTRSTQGSSTSTTPQQGLFYGYDKRWEVALLRIASEQLPSGMRDRRQFGGIFESDR